MLLLMLMFGCAANLSTLPGITLFPAYHKMKDFPGTSATMETVEEVINSVNSEYSRAAVRVARDFTLQTGSSH